MACTVIRLAAGVVVLTAIMGCNGATGRPGAAPSTMAGPGKHATQTKTAGRPAMTPDEEVAALKQKLGDERVWFVPAVDTPPVIDGKIEDLWKKSRAHRFVWLNNKVFGKPKEEPKDRPKMPTEPTDGYMLCDAENLYVAFVCHTAPGAGVVGANPTKGRDKVWSGADYVEVMVDPTHSKKKGFQFIVECYGTFSDVIYDPGKHGTPQNQYGEFIPWIAPNVKWATSIGTDVYYVEIQIPFRDIDVVPGKVGRVWGLSINRFTPRPGRFKEEDTAIGFTGEYASGRAKAFGQAILEVGTK